jgi:hypothetical protein
VLLEVRQTDVAGLRAIEHDEDVRELNKRNKEDWKNDKMVRGLRFAIPKRAGASSIVTLQGAMNIMACGEAEDGRPPTTHDKRVEGTEEDQRFFPTSVSARRGEREY